MIGFDAPLFSAIRLNSVADNNRSEVFQIGNDGKLEDGYSKLSQALVKLKLEQNGVALNAKIGLQVIDNPLLNGLSSRATPSSYEGIDTSLRFADFGLHYNWVEKSSQRFSSSFDDLKTFSGAKIDNLQIVRATYDPTENLGFELGRGESKDYLQQSFARATWKLEPREGYKVTVDGRVFKAESAGTLGNNNSDLLGSLSRTGNAADY